MPASYRDAVRGFVSLVVNQRDELVKAIRDDASPEARQRRDEFIRERQQDQRDAGSNAAGFRVPGGEATRLLAAVDPRNEVGDVPRAFYAANVAVADAGLGAHFLPMLKSVRDAHADLCRNARLAFEASASQVSGDILQEHGRVISELLDGVGWDEADQPEKFPTYFPLQDDPPNRKGVTMSDESPGWACPHLPSMTKDVEEWLGSLICRYPDFQVTLTRQQIAFLNGYVIPLSVPLPSDVHDTSDHYAERPLWPKRVRYLQSGGASCVIIDELPSPHPYDVGGFLRQVLAFNESGKATPIEALRTTTDPVSERSQKAMPSPRSLVSRTERSNGKPAWVTRLHDLKREFLQAAKMSRLRIVLVQSANGQDVNDLQPTADDLLRIESANQPVSLPDGTPAWRFTYEFGKPNDPAKRLMERGDDILKAHGEEILRLFGLRFIDSWKNWAWLLWQLKNVEHPYQGDIEAESTMAGVLSPNESQQAFAWALGCGPKPDWFAERRRSFRVDLPHAAAASIAAIRAILDRVGTVPQAMSNQTSGINAEEDKPLHEAAVVADKPTRSTRRRRSSGPTKSLTVKQTEALKLHGDCEGNISEVARRMGIDRSTAKQHVDEAFRKLGKSVPTKSKTTSLKTDRRGQVDVIDTDDHRG